MQPLVNNTPGKLIAVEGLDGSGKSTQVYLIKRWLELSGYKVFFTEWNSSAIVRERHPEGEEAEPPHADHLLPHPLHRLRRPVRAEHPPDAQGGVHRPGGPVQVHRARARHRPGVPAGVGRAALQLRVPAGHHLLLLPPAANGAGPDPRRSPGAQIPRGGDGPRPLPGPRGELQDLPGEDPQGVRDPRAQAPVHPDRLGSPRGGDPGGGPGDPARPDRPRAIQVAVPRGWRS